MKKLCVSIRAQSITMGAISTYIFRPPRRCKRRIGRTCVRQSFLSSPSFEIYGEHGVQVTNGDFIINESISVHRK